MKEITCSYTRCWSERRRCAVFNHHYKTVEKICVTKYSIFRKNYK